MSRVINFNPVIEGVEVTAFTGNYEFPIEVELGDSRGPFSTRLQLTTEDAGRLAACLSDAIGAIEGGADDNG